MHFSFPFSVAICWAKSLFKQYSELETAFTTDLGIKAHKLVMFAKYQTSDVCLISNNTFDIYLLNIKLVMFAKYQTILSSY